MVVEVGVGRGLGNDGSRVFRPGGGIGRGGACRVCVVEVEGARSALPPMVLSLANVMLPLPVLLPDRPARAGCPAVPVPLSVRFSAVVMPPDSPSVAPLSTVVPEAVNGAWALS